MFTAKVSDHSGGIYCAFPRDLGDQVIGMTATEFKEFRASNTTEEVDNYLNMRLFKVSTTMY